MKNYLPLIGFSLLTSLFIYVFYRTEKTIVNQLVIRLFSKESWQHWKTIVNEALPLRETIVYSLPEGLWVFCITLTSRFFRLSVFGYRIDVALVPILLAVTMEICQLLHLGNGRFDPMDLLIAALFWWVAYVFADTTEEKRELRLRRDFNSLSCMFFYGIVYLAHVIK
ncbi:MAG: hypothetical protein EOO09_06815 [Chitinophagaceae bacterium]|nr:MAG: hypothetical protein EOO09_06815 [Chitinophagaceae bacterium]